MRREWDDERSSVRTPDRTRLFRAIRTFERWRGGRLGCAGGLNGGTAIVERHRARCARGMTASARRLVQRLQATKLRRQGSVGAH